MFKLLKGLKNLAEAGFGKTFIIIIFIFCFNNISFKWGFSWLGFLITCIIFFLYEIRRKTKIRSPSSITLTWLLCAKRLPIDKDSAQIIAKMVWQNQQRIHPDCHCEMRWNSKTKRWSHLKSCRRNLFLLATLHCTCPSCEGIWFNPRYYSEIHSCGKIPMCHYHPTKQLKWDYRGTLFCLRCRNWICHLCWMREKNCLNGKHCTGNKNKK